MALTHHDDLEMMIGDEWVINGHLLDENGQPIDVMAPGITMGWSLVGPDGNMVPGVTDAASLEPLAGGDVLISVPDSFTRTLNPARYLNAIRVYVNGAASTEWTGIILAAADPFHPTVTLPALEEPTMPTFEDAPDDGNLYARRGGQWVEVPSGFSTKFEYTYDDGITAPPTNSQLRFDNVDPFLATKIWLHNNDADGLDVSNLLTLVETGFTIFVQDKDDPTKRVRYQATDMMTNLGTYCEIPVVFVAGLGTLNDNQRLLVVVWGGG
jgi:hypothetical protein